MCGENVPSDVFYTTSGVCGSFQIGSHVLQHLPSSTRVDIYPKVQPPHRLTSGRSGSNTAAAACLCWLCAFLTLILKKNTCLVAKLYFLCSLRTSGPSCLSRFETRKHGLEPAVVRVSAAVLRCSPTKGKRGAKLEELAPLKMTLSPLIVYLPPVSPI